MSASSQAYFDRVGISWVGELREIMLDVIEKVGVGLCGDIQKSDVPPLSGAPGNKDSISAYLKMASRALVMVLTHNIKITIRNELSKFTTGKQASLKYNSDLKNPAFIGVGANEGATLTAEKQTFGGNNNTTTIGTVTVQTTSTILQPLSNEVAISAAKNDAMEPLMLRLKCDAVMSSAILAAPGSETGELLIGYPFTSISKFFCRNPISCLWCVCMCSKQQMRLFLR